MRMRKNAAIRLVHRIIVTRVIARSRTPDQIDQFVCSQKVVFCLSLREAVFTELERASSDFSLRKCLSIG